MSQISIRSIIQGSVVRSRVMLTCMISPAQETLFILLEICSALKFMSRTIARMFRGIAKRVYRDRKAVFTWTLFVSIRRWVWPPYRVMCIRCNREAPSKHVALSASRRWRGVAPGSWIRLKKHKHGKYGAPESFHHCPAGRAFRYNAEKSVSVCHFICKKYESDENVANHKQILEVSFLLQSDLVLVCLGYKSRPDQTANLNPEKSSVFSRIPDYEIMLMK